MKIRQGFVTNSSSSSYVLMGISSSYKEAREARDKNEYNVIGKYLSDGMDIFTLDNEMIEYLDKFDEGAINGAFSFVRTILYSGDGDGVSIKELYKIVSAEIIVNPDGDLIAFGGEADYHKSENAEDLRMRYGDQLGDPEGGEYDS